MTAVPIRTVLRTLAAGLLAAVLVVPAASVVLAHPGGPEEVLVVGDHVEAGATFQLLASSIEPDVDVAVRVLSGSASFDVGSVHVSSDGTLDVMLTLPTGVPNGYAELHLAQPTQGDAGTTFLVGPRPEGPPAASGSAQSFLDTRLGALLVFGLTLAGIVAIGVLLVRGRSAPRP